MLPVLLFLFSLGWGIPSDSPVATQSAQADLGRAQALLDAGRPDEAVPLLETALVLRPGYPLVLAGLAAAYAAVEDPRAEALLEHAIAADPKNLPLR